MGKQKKQTNTYGYQTPPETADINAAREWKPQSNPAIGYNFANARQRLRNTFNNPLGADTPAAVKDAIIYSGENDLAQQEGQMLREEGVDLNNQEWQKRFALAELTKPQLVQTGQSGPGLGSSLISGGSQVAAAALF